MNTILLPFVQELEKSKAFQVGYEVGYFFGSNFWEIVTGAVIILAAIIYLAFFRKRSKNNWT